MPSYVVRFTLLLAALIVLGGSALVGLAVAERYYVRQTNIQSDATLRLAASGLSGALQKFESVPKLLADHPSVRSLLDGSATASDLDALNEKLKSVASEVGASDIYVLNATGLAIAASNFDKETTFIGNYYTFRPYYSDAMQGNQGRYYALGTSSQKRGFYFSEPVMLDGSPIGVLAVKFTVDELELKWNGFNHDLIVTDPDGIIFMSSRSDWLFSAINPLSHETLNRLRDSKRYPVDQLTSLGATYTEGTNEARLTFSQDLGGAEYLVRSQFMPEANWTLHILTDRSLVFRQSVQATLIAGLIVLLITILTIALLAWRSRQAQHIREQEEAKLLLEERVAERTSDLQREIGERIQAERDLRKAQNELVQAGKLAALGQMSAALSHELNQPLSAVKSYADNAGAFLDRNRPDDAKANLSHISALTDRMAQISNSLRNFARKPREQIGLVSLAAVLKDVEQIMVGRLTETKATLRVSPVVSDLTVIGGHVRLQQVLVNLVNNALDAMEGQPDPTVEITVIETAEQVDIRVKDHGRGIDDDIFEQIFDPFFTTKGVNRGLGLGLSISFNILRDFGGNLSATNNPEGGAVFIATLVKPIMDQEAAE